MDAVLQHDVERGERFAEQRVDEVDAVRGEVDDRAAVPIDWAGATDPRIEAISFVEGATPAPRALTGGLALPRPDATLTPNPLLDHGVVRWPSDRYRDEYGPGCLWSHAVLPARALPDPARLRRLVDLPDRW